MVQVSMGSREGANHKEEVIRLQSYLLLASIASAVPARSNTAFYCRQIVAVDKSSATRMQAHSCFCAHSL